MTWPAGKPWFVTPCIPTRRNVLCGNWLGTVSERKDTTDSLEATAQPAGAKAANVPSSAEMLNAFLHIILQHIEHCVFITPVPSPVDINARHLCLYVTHVTYVTEQAKMSQRIITLQLSTMIFMIWHAQHNIEVWRMSADFQKWGKNIRPQANSQYCNLKTIQRAKKNKEQKIEPQNFPWQKRCSRKGKIFSNDSSDWRPDFFWMRCECLLVWALRLTSMPTPILWTQDFQQQEPPWDPEDDLLES